MKLLHINATISSGSTGSIIQNISKTIEKNNLDIDTYIAFSVGTASKNGFKFINSFEYFIIRAVRKLFGKTMFGLYFPTKRLIKYIDKLNPDIIHIHTIHHQTLNYKMLFKYLKGFKGKVFYTLHDCWAFTGGCYYYSEFGCDCYTDECKKCLQRKTDIDCKNSFVNREFNYKKVAFTAVPNITFIAVSDWLAGEAKKSFLRDKEIITVHNGINSEIFKPEAKEKTNQFTVISVASYWGPRKHLDILLDFSKEFSDIKFIVIGDINRKIDSKDYPNVVFYGTTQNAKELCNLYNKADIFANFSTEETFGLVTAEAMACGLPVIAFNKTACSEIVTPDCGYAVDSIEEYKNALLKLKDADLSDYRNCCIREVLGNYTNEVMAKKYIDLYVK